MQALSASAEQIYLWNLPLEILDPVFQQLAPQDLCRLSRTNNFFYNAVNDGHVWKCLYLDFWDRPADLESFSWKEEFAYRFSILKRLGRQQIRSSSGNSSTAIDVYGLEDAASSSRHFLLASLVHILRLDGGKNRNTLLSHQAFAWAFDLVNHSLQSLISSDEKSTFAGHFLSRTKAAAATTEKQKTKKKSSAKASAGLKGSSASLAIEVLMRLTFDLNCHEPLTKEQKYALPAEPECLRLLHTNRDEVMGETLPFCLPFNANSDFAVSSAALIALYTSHLLSVPLCEFGKQLFAYSEAEDDEQISLEKLRVILEGGWRGYYFYTLAQYDPEMVMSMQVKAADSKKGCTIYAKGCDSVGTFQIRGSIAGVGKLFVLEKKYDNGGPTWEYTGKLWNFGMCGRWGSLGWGGTWFFWKCSDSNPKPYRQTTVIAE